MLFLAQEPRHPPLPLRESLMGERAEVTRIISLNIREAHLKRRFRLVLSPITTVCAARHQQQC